MKTPAIQFEECDTPEKLENLREFVKTFDPPHVLPDKPIHRIMIVKRDGVWIGASEIVMTPMVVTMWSKERCKPQDIWEAMKAFVGWSRIQYGEGYTAVPLDTKKFPAHIMAKLGFQRVGAELYRVSN